MFPTPIPSDSMQYLSLEHLLREILVNTAVPCRWVVEHSPLQAPSHSAQDGKFLSMASLPVCGFLCLPFHDV